MDNSHSSVRFHCQKNITHLPAFLCEFCPSSAWCILLSIHCDLSEKEKIVRLMWTKGWVAFLCRSFKLDRRWRCCQIWRLTIFFFFFCKSQEPKLPVNVVLFTLGWGQRHTVLQIIITASSQSCVWILCCFFTPVNCASSHTCLLSVHVALITDRSDNRNSFLWPNNSARHSAQTGYPESRLLFLCVYV